MPVEASAKPCAAGEGEEPAAVVALALAQLGEALGAARADLDLGVDQLAADRFGERLVLLRSVAELLEAVRELEGLGVEDRELLLDGAR